MHQFEEQSDFRKVGTPFGVVTKFSIELERSKSKSSTTKSRSSSSSSLITLIWWAFVSPSIFFCSVCQLIFWQLRHKTKRERAFINKVNKG